MSFPAPSLLPNPRSPTHSGPTASRQPPFRVAAFLPCSVLAGTNWVTVVHHCSSLWASSTKGPCTCCNTGYRCSTCNSEPGKLSIVIFEPAGSKTALSHEPSDRWTLRDNLNPAPSVIVFDLRGSNSETRGPDSQSFAAAAEFEPGMPILSLLNLRVQKYHGIVIIFANHRSLFSPAWPNIIQFHHISKLWNPP
jgi:hypothetical protein